jgi:hypothetical protein
MSLNRRRLLVAATGITATGPAMAQHTQGGQSAAEGKTAQTYKSYGSPATAGLRGGSLGVQSVHEHLKSELVMVMQLAGTPTIKSITGDHVIRAELDA